MSYGEKITSKVWTQYQKDRLSGNNPQMADFSYAGYHCGEKEIPTVNWKVFDVTKFGAIPNDELSDKKAIIRAITAAEKNGSGIIFFPKGRFLINETSDQHNKPIMIKTDNIILRGSGSGPGGTELYMGRHMDPSDPEKLWTCPYMIQFKGRGLVRKVTDVVADVSRESHNVTVADSSLFTPGDWVLLQLKDNSEKAVAAAVAPYKINPAWTSLIKNGVMIDELHQIDKIIGDKVIFKEPIHTNILASQKAKLKKFQPLEEVGVENISFVGNWKEKFVHHKNAIHDGGWSLLQLNNCANSWVRNCQFKDVNRAVTIKKSVKITVEDIMLLGNPGHNAVLFSGCSHSLMRHVNDKTGLWHSCGVSGKCSGNVILRCQYTENTCYEAHASQPRWTLFDNVTGGWIYGRWGGAKHNQPNHLEGLVFWNYKKIGKGEPGKFHFMRPDSAYGRIIMPYVIGFHGRPQSWVQSEIKVLESNGKRVLPDSLYEAQLELRRREKKNK